MMVSDRPVALTIAGSDSSAGAGAQADLKTFSARGVYGVNAITCVVAEAPGKVSSIQAVDPERVRDQIEVLFASFPIAAVKTGMLYSSAIIAVVADALDRVASAGMSVPLVVDPVMVATSGDRLLQPDAIEAYEQKLFPRATVITPNLDEVGALLGRRVVNLDDMRAAGADLLAKYGVPFLVKGGHLAGDEAIDLLFDGETVHDFCSPFTRAVGTHGTGCTYSAAITAELAKGRSVRDAIATAKEFVSRSIGQYFSWPTSSVGATHALNHSPEKP
jgi:hydroxymethylpyrimidine/phosphomethylpyrimidine kinase